METFLEILQFIFRFLFVACITIISLGYLGYMALTVTETNAKVTAIYNNLGLDTIPSDSVNLNRGDTINFNVIFK